MVSDTNEQLGVMSLRSARQIAEERHLDLVEIAANAKPPVCRIMNYGKGPDVEESKITSQH